MDMNRIDEPASGLDVEGAEGSLPTADEVKNLQNFIDDEQGRNKRKLTKRQMYILGGIVGGLFVIIMSISIGIAKRSGPSRENDVVSFLSGSFADRGALTSKNSPQKKAAKWIADEDKMSMPLPATTNYEDAYKFVQRYALAVLYFAWAGDEKWIFNYQFLSEKDECDWNYKYKTTDSDDAFELGVKCNDDGEIDYLFMPGNGLEGQIPGEIGLLLALNHLSLFNNNLGGALPPQMMYMTDLKFLALEENAITGTIPDWIGALTSMKFMALGNNRLTGEIPEALTSMTKLSELSLEGNSLEGNVTILNEIPTLTRLFLGANKLDGKIDHYFLGELTDLRELDLSSNTFTGTLPHHFFDYEILDLHDNDLEGEIPSLTRDDYPLQYLLLHNNGFSGRLHNTIANLQSLTRLDVSNNELTGEMPESIGDMDQLQYLYVANNEWTEGPIPVWHNLTGMIELSLKGTNRVGTVPDWLGREMRNLELLSLDNNNLTGEIPQQLGHCKQMEYLLLNQNNLSGNVPETFDHMHQLKMLRLDDNQLEGGADPVCADLPKNLGIFTSDCGNGAFECKCCTNCCADDNDQCGVGAELPVNDISWKHGYPKNQALFSEDLVFENIGSR